VAGEPQNLCLVPFCLSLSPVGQALPQFPPAPMRATGGCQGAQRGAGCSRQAGDARGARPPSHHPPLALLPGVQLRQVPEGPEGEDAGAGGEQPAGAGGRRHR